MKTIMLFALFSLIVGGCLVVVFLSIFYGNTTIMRLAPVVGLISGVIGILAAGQIIDKFKLY